MALTKKTGEKRQQTLFFYGFKITKPQRTLLFYGFRITKSHGKAASKLGDSILKPASHVTSTISTSEVPSTTTKEIEDIQVSTTPCPTATKKEENNQLSAEKTQLSAELEAGLEELRSKAGENLKSQARTDNVQDCDSLTQQKMKGAPHWMPKAFVQFLSAEVLESQRKKKRAPRWVPKELLQFFPAEMVESAQLCAEHVRRKNVNWRDLAMTGYFRGNYRG